MANAMTSGHPMDHHVFTPPSDHQSPSKLDGLSTFANGISLVPMEIPKRESVSSASQVPLQTSPPPGLQPLSAVSSASGTAPHWQPTANSASQTLPPMEPEANYLTLYELKQAQLEQAEKAHKELMDEVTKARSRAEELAEKIQDELRREVKSVRKVEETLREKVEDQLRKERAAWNAEREMLMQRMKSPGDQSPFIAKLHHKEHENQALRVRIEQLKARLKICEAKCGLASEFSPGPEDGVGLYSPSRHTSISSSRRLASPDGKNGRHTSVDRHAFFSSRRPTPNMLKAQEAPYEPPATAVPPQSPPPPAYRRHAGHTPGASVSLTSPGGELASDKDPGADTPTQATFGSLLGVAKNGVPAAESSKEQTLRRASDQLDDDPPLKGPLGLRNDPEDSSFFLEMLNKKLCDVSDDPASNKPKVLKRDTDELSVISESVDGQSNHDSNESDNPSQGTRQEESSTEQAGDDEEPIPLRLKPSMNFGAPLGHALSP